MFTELPVGLVCQLPWDTQLSRTGRLWRPRGQLLGRPDASTAEGQGLLPESRGLRPAPLVHHCPLGPSACAVTAGEAWAAGWGCSRQPTGAATAELVSMQLTPSTRAPWETPTLAVSTFLHWLHRCGLGAQHPVLCAIHFPNLTDGSVLQLVFSVFF